LTMKLAGIASPGMGEVRVRVRITNSADAQAALGDGLRFELMNRRSGDEALVLGDEVLIGQTLLEKMDLMVDCKERRLVPNPAHPDVPVSKGK
jgi:hypothetical protein